jgi:hypothetical protein
MLSLRGKQKTLNIMSKMDFMELCELNCIAPSIALENDLIRETLKEIKDRKLNSIKGQLLINSILQNQF